MAPKQNILALCDFLKGDGEDVPIAIQQKPASVAKSPINPKKRPAAAPVSSKKPAAAMDAMADDSEPAAAGLDPYSETFSNHISTGFVFTITSI